jgi:hypothetical protein
MTFLYVSGAGTDSSEKGRTMWARVKGKTENALLRLPSKAAYMFRPGVVQPLHRMQSKTASYRVLYTAMDPILPLVRWLLPQYVTTTEILGRAMIHVAQNGHPKRILKTATSIKSPVRCRDTARRARLGCCLASCPLRRIRSKPSPC